jgi:hypothetical protein
MKRIRCPRLFEFSDKEIFTGMSYNVLKWRIVSQKLIRAGGQQFGV